MADIIHIKDLTPDPNNARRHNPRNVGMIERALGEVGPARSIVIDEHATVLAGNATIEAAAAAGFERVIVVEASGNELIAVRRSNLTPEQKIRLALYDNRAAELAEWDASVLASIADSGVDIGALWTPDELAAIVPPADVVPGAGGDEFDVSPDLAQTRTTHGDLWLIDGKHRMVVGDATDPAVVDQLTAGAKVDMVFIDPPYGVEYVGKTSASLTIAGDSNDDEATRANVAQILRAAPMRPGTVFYLCSPPGTTETAFRLAIRDASMKHHQNVVWVKHHFVLGHQDYQVRHESILYGWMEGAAHYFVADRTLDTVWEIDRPMASVDHPTMKPVELVERAIRNSTRRDGIVYDGCLGSGTTIIASHRTGRVCYGCEIDPAYADVVLRRCEAEGLMVERIHP